MKKNIKFKIWKLIDKFLIEGILIFLMFLKIFRIKREVRDINPKKILIIEFLGFGDVVLTLPALVALKKKFPKSEIDVLTFKPYLEVLRNQSYINKVHTNELNFIIKNIQKYDLTVDFGQFTKYSGLVAFILGKTSIGYSHGLRGKIYDKPIRFIDGQHMSSSFFNLVAQITQMNFSGNLEKIIYLSTENSKKILSQLKDNTKIAMHIGASTSQTKRCWPIDYFSKVAESLLKKDKKIKIILLGTNEEREDCERLKKSLGNKFSSRVINIAGLTSLNEAVEIISNMDFFIGNDSGPMHISAAQGVKTLGIFAANSPIRYKPLNKKSKYIFKCECKDRPCINVHLGSGEPAKKCLCNLCYRLIKPEEVLKIVYKNL
jgi:heptosyltransferase-2